MYKNNVIDLPSRSQVTKTIIIVHPNPVALNQLINSFENEGYLVYGFKRVQDANRRILFFNKNRVHISGIVVPKRLWVSTQLTYEQFLNHMLPQYRVYTVDNKDYRETVNLKTWRNV